MFVIVLSFGNMQAKWDEGEGLAAKPKLMVARDCLLKCGGKHKHSFTLYGKFGEYRVDKIEPANYCNRCGNLAGLTSRMVREILDKATIWAAPQVEELLAEQELEKELWKGLHDNERTNKDALINLRRAGVDIREIYRKAAGESTKRLVELMEGDWWGVVSIFIDYIPPLQGKHVGYPAPFLQHHWWAAMVWGKGSEHEQIVAHTRFYQDWMKYSQGRFRRSGKMTVQETHWLFTEVDTLTDSETDFVLGRLVDNGPFRFMDGKKLKQFRLHYHDGKVEQHPTLDDVEPYYQLTIAPLK